MRFLTTDHLPSSEVKAARPDRFQRIFEGPDEIEQFPDPFGRIGLGATAIRDPTFDPTGQELLDDFRTAFNQGRSLPELFGPRDTLEIKAGIGAGRQNRRPDVAKLETFLDALGEHDAARTDGPTGYYGIGFEDNLKAYQARNGLTPDGIVNPTGETLGRIKQDLADTLGAERLAGGDDLSGGMEPGARLIPAQATGPSPIERGSEPSDPERLARQQFLEASRESERRPKRQEKEEFLEASRGSERRLPGQVRELDRKYRLMLWAAEQAHIQFRPAVNLEHAIPAMRRYLDGTGGTVRYDADWIRKQPIIKRGEDRVLSHFADWMRGKSLKSGGLPPAIANKILKLKPGESVSGGTDRSAVARFVNPTKYDKTTDFYNTSKDSNIKGIGSFSFTRKGNKIFVTGTIEQNWRDKFDFEPGKVFEIPIEGSPVKIVTDELIFLRGVGMARTFQQRSSWRRRAVGQIEITKDPITGKERIGDVTLKWSD